jgi:hypothetical protein
LPEVTEQAFRDLCARIADPISNIRLLTSLNAHTHRTGMDWAVPEALLALHDLTFLALKVFYDRLVAHRGSFFSLFLDSLFSDTAHAFSGMFSGLIKCAAFELPQCLTFGVFTNAVNPKLGIRQVERESAADRLLPIAVYQDEARRAIVLKQVDVELPAEAPARIDSTSVIVAAGRNCGRNSQGCCKALAADPLPDWK